MDERRRKIQFRAWSRGFRELDLIMGAFADEHLAQLSEDDTTEFERLLTIADWDLYAWIIGQKPVPDNQKSSVLDRLMAFSLAQAK